VQRARSVDAPSSEDRADLADLAAARVFAKDHPEDDQAQSAWAHAAYRAGALREARHAGESWALHDDSAAPRVFIASVLEATGHRGDARAVLEQWLELHPNSSEARRLRARMAVQAPPASLVVHKTSGER
jgi:hypothetical protein